MRFRPWHAALMPAAILVYAWGSAALGSYVFLSGLGYKNQFAFPWLQLWVALPYVFGEWNGLRSLNLWSWSAVGVAAGIMPTLLPVMLAVRRYFDRRRQPALYGRTGWADRSDMRRGGIRWHRSPFE